MLPALLEVPVLVLARAGRGEDEPLAGAPEAHRPAGLRTFPIVSVASCAFVLVGLGAFPNDLDAQSRILQGLMTGIGFIGGGAILKQSDTGMVRGLTTAASLWTTAAIGAAVAYERFELAALLTIVNFVILHWMRSREGS